ncbi:tail fiber domain-containing protein [Undibacterium curvum]|uniref:tail fiber domain-containing protein n=1 Tax=Undibacterium curvum TaxID=2762294 RepID=UPI003D0AB117
MPDLFKPGDRDYVQKLNQLWQQVQAAGGPLNPAFSTFSGNWVIPDVRPGKKMPQSYQSRAAVIEFNTADNFDNPPGMVSASFPFVMTVAGWSADGAGGAGLPVQLNFGDGLAYRRGSSAATWTPWKRVSSYDDRVAAFGSSNAVGQNLSVSGDNASAGAGVAVLNGGSTVVAMGNKSGVVGGPYDSTPYIYGAADIESNVGLTINRTLTVQNIQESMRLKSDGACVTFWNAANTSRSAYIQAMHKNVFEIAADVGSRMLLTTNGVGQITISLGGDFYPVADGIRYNGLAANRWAAMYSITGTIQTSDARKKTAVKQFTAAMRAAAREIHESIGVYQWLDAVAEKGQDKARWHVGLTVQRAISILEKHGIDPFSLGFICHDVWSAEYEKRQTNVGAKVIKHREVRKQKVTVHERDQEVIEIINDKPVLVVRPVVTKEPVFVDAPVSRPDGSPVVDESGQQMTVRLPDMETVSEPYEADADPVYEDVLIREAGDGFSFRYDELTLFILAGLAPI